MVQIAHSVKQLIESAAKPTAEQYGTYQALYDYLNVNLFNNSLPPVVLTFTRRPNICGYFSRDRWERGAEKAHEIALNPALLAEESCQEVCQTIAHEMVHLQQYIAGTNSRPGYHNEDFAQKMEAIGLMASGTGKPGGARTGQKMADYIIEGGIFQQVFKNMPESLRLPWKANEALLPAGTIQMLNQLIGGHPGGTGAAPSQEKPKSKVKFTCPECKARAWGKPGLNLVCG